MKTLMKKPATGQKKLETSSAYEHEMTQNNEVYKTADIAMMRQAVTNPSSLDPHTVVQLNRLHGNRFVSRLIQRSKHWLEGDSPTASSSHETPHGAETISMLTHPERAAVQRDPQEEAVVDEKSRKFAQGFKDAFESALHLFPKDSENKVSAQALQSLFTDTQRAKLSTFFDSKIIPERLFNGDDIGKSSAQQRMLIAAHILEIGTYTPGSFEQKVHAKFCGHWARLVRHYAGATTSKDLQAGVEGNFDHDGNIVLGKADSKVQQISSSLGKERVYEDDLSSDEGDGIGPLSGNHAERAKKVDRKLFREYGLTMDQLKTIQPGDWLYYYNANASGTHSVIFSQWLDSTIKSVDGTEIQYRQAEVFSQPSNDRGGKRHSSNIGTGYYNQEGMEVFPVTQIYRVSPESVPAQTVNELFPDFTNARVANEQVVKDILKKKGLPVDLKKVMAELRMRNTGLLSSITDRLTPKQLELLNAANNGQDTEIVIGLYQMLHGLVHNAKLLQTKHNAHYAQKNAEYDALKGEKDTKEAANNLLLDEIAITLTEYDSQVDVLKKQRTKADLQGLIDRLMTLETGLLSREGTEDALDPFQVAIAAVTKQRDDYNLQPVLQTLTTLRDALGPWNPKRGHPFYSEIKVINRQIKSIRKLNNSGYKRINAEIKALQTPEIKKALKKREALEKENAKLDKAMPYGLAQAGSMRAEEEKINMTGRLLHVFSESELKTTKYLKSKDEMQGEVVLSR